MGERELGINMHDCTESRKSLSLSFPLCGAPVVKYVTVRYVIQLDDSFFFCFVARACE
jgi:hypothetical protein